MWALPSVATDVAAILKENYPALFSPADSSPSHLPTLPGVTNTQLVGMSTSSVPVGAVTVTA